jgi:hypothetical protein
VGLVGAMVLAAAALRLSPEVATAE